MTVTSVVLALVLRSAGLSIVTPTNWAADASNSVSWTSEATDPLSFCKRTEWMWYLDIKSKKNSLAIELNLNGAPVQNLANNVATSLGTINLLLAGVQVT